MVDDVVLVVVLIDVLPMLVVVLETETNCLATFKETEERSFACWYNKPHSSPIKNVAIKTNTAMAFEYHVTLFHSIFIYAWDRT